MIIAVPALSHIEPETDAALREAERAGIRVARYFGMSAIDQARSLIATELMADGHDAIFWIDSDMVFEPTDILKLAASGKPLIGGAYSRKGFGRFSFSTTSNQIGFGTKGGVVRVTSIPGGFTYVHQSVYETVAKALPICDGERPVVPFYLPLVVPEHGAMRYLSEDFAFCYRACQAGIACFLDTTVRLSHKGSYLYGWEEACGQPPRRAEDAAIG